MAVALSNLTFLLQTMQTQEMLARSEQRKAVSSFVPEKGLAQGGAESLERVAEEQALLFLWDCLLLWGQDRCQRFKRGCSLHSGTECTLSLQNIPGFICSRQD